MKKLLPQSRRWWLIVILASVFMLRLPSLFEPYWYGDEGITLTMGQAWREGRVLYRDIHDNKPPLLYFIAGLAGNLFALKLILTIWVLFTIILFWNLVWKINLARDEHDPKLSSLPLTSLLAVIIFSLLISLPFWEGNLANGEIFMMAPVIGAMTIIFSLFHNQTTLPFSTFKNFLGRLVHLRHHRKLNSRYLWLMTAGGLFGIGFLFKHPAFTDFITGLIFIVYLIKVFNKQTLSQLFRDSLSLTTGFIIPIATVSLIFLYLHSWSSFIQDVFLNNFFYVSVWVPESQWGSTTAFGGTLLQRFIVLMIICGVLWKLRQRLKTPILFISLWFSWSLFGALLSSRPYPHYLLQVVPSLSLLIAWGVLSLPKFSFRQPLGIFGLKYPLTFSLIALAILYLAWIRINFWRYSVAGYYTNFITYVSGARSPEDYLQWFDPRVLSTYRLAAWINAHLSSTDSLFIWGDDTMIYPLTSKLPDGPYIAAYHINQFHAQETTITILRRTPPTYIVRLNSAPNTFLQLNELISRRYHLIQNSNYAQIFQLGHPPS